MHVAGGFKLAGIHLVIHENNLHYEIGLKTKKYQDIPPKAKKYCEAHSIAMASHLAGFWGPDRTQMKLIIMINTDFF